MVAHRRSRPGQLVGFGDADAFYVAAERVRRPWLDRVPTGVLGNQGACVIARCYEMRRYKIKVGMPVWEAKKLCPDGVYLKRDFRWYEVLSRKVRAVLEQHSDCVEPYSIDESFWRGYSLPGRSYQDTAVAIRDQLKTEVGVPVTVTFARTRTLAKLFADTAKPFGALAVETEEHERELLANLPITEISGIAARRAARLAPYGIKTCLDLRDACEVRMRKVLSVVGRDLILELRGIPMAPIRPSRTPHKMIARGGSLAGRIQDFQTVHGWLARNTERLIEELHFHEVRPRCLSVMLAYSDAEAAGKSVHLGVPSDRFDTLLAAAKIALNSAWRRGCTATHMHVIASRLVRRPGWTQSLFEQADPRLDALAAVKRDINEQFGRFKLRSGATLWANAFYSDPANAFDICDVRGKFCF